MPVEIKELIIRASVRDESEGNRGNNQDESVAGKTNTTQEERIVNRCVEQIMDIMRIKYER